MIIGFPWTIQKQEELNIKSDPPSKEEMAIAIKLMRTWKAAGLNRIQAELLKADPTKLKNATFNLFNIIWEKKNNIPNDWAKLTYTKFFENMVTLATLKIVERYMYKTALNSKQGVLLSHLKQNW